MSDRDTRDPRTFNHFAKVDGAGHIVAIVEVDTAVPDGPVDAEQNVYVDVTEAKHKPEAEKLKLVTAALQVRADKKAGKKGL